MGCSVAILCEGHPSPVIVGITRDQRTLLLVKRQLIEEAQGTLREAEEAEVDDVLIVDIRDTLHHLQRTLDLLIPSARLGTNSKHKQEDE